MLLASLAWVAGCLSSPDGWSSFYADAGTLRVVAFRVLDRDGYEVSTDRVPPWPRLEVHMSAPLASSSPGPLLLRGHADATLLEDAARPPLRMATRARAVSAVTEHDEHGVTLVPIERLRPGAHVLLVPADAIDVMGRTLGTPLVVELSVVAEESIRWTDVWPADGTAGVPPRLPFAAVRFETTTWRDGAVEARLIDDTGEPLDTTGTEAACEEVGWHGGHCLLLRLRNELPRGREVRVRVQGESLDTDGVPSDGIVARWRVLLEDDTDPPRLRPDRCEPGSIATPAGCAWVDDARLELVVRASEPVRLWLHQAGGARTSAVAGRGEARLQLPVAELGRPHRVRVRAVDAAGLEHHVSLELDPSTELAPLAVTEVCADPEGREPDQEFVEIVHHGRTPLVLDGYRLRDATGEDVLVLGAPVPPGARVLVVGRGFDADLARVPGGTMLIRVDGPLGSGGLSNAGEAIGLLDPAGRHVSGAPAMRPARPGACIVRTVSDPRARDAEAFAHDPEGTCTPGRASWIEPRW
ncbi:MAG: lamin tail domain-containing protein [Myxococcota bacterium]|nr:lamin tail domain-containing protein [Myxococcota bacterium]MDW8363670.1 hypothetical protein [Myxococcales bacterium]